MHCPALVEGIFSVIEGLLNLGVPYEGLHKNRDLFWVYMGVYLFMKKLPFLSVYALLFL